MAEPIRHEDIIQIDKTLDGIKKIIKELKKLQAEMKKTAKNVIAFQTKQDPTKPGGKAGTKQATAETQKLVKENKKLADSLKVISKEEVRLKKIQKERNAEVRRQAQVMDAASGSLNRNRVALQKLSERYSKAAPAAAKKMEGRISALTNKIKVQEAAIGRHQRNVGNYKSAFGKAKKAILAFGVGMVGVTAIMSIMTRGFRKIVGIAMEFDQGMANVKAITNASRKEFNALTISAITLGRSTKFTATQVSELQFEFAKLGFTTEEIIGASKATLDLAAATGTDLARAASVAGGVLRAFNIDASDTQRVTDVMAKSFAISALDMEKFAESMKVVSKVADVSELSIERTTAILAVLANNMIDSSRAGTALRRILAETGSTAEGFEGRLRALTESSLSLAEAQDEVGQRAFGALLVLTEQWEMVDLLTIALINAEGANARMAEVMLDTAKGQKDIANSAFEGLVLTAENATEGMESYKKSLSNTAKALNWVSDNFTQVSKTASIFGKALIAPITSNKILFNLITKKRRTEKEFAQEEADRIIEEDRLARLELQRIKEEGEALALAHQEKQIQIEEDEKAQLKRSKAFTKAKQQEIKLLKQEQDLFRPIEQEKADAHEAFQEMLDADLEALTKEIDAEIALWDKRNAEDKKVRDEEGKAEDERARGRDAVRDEIANTLFALTDLKMAKLNEEKANEIQAAKGNKEKILAIEKKFAKEQQKVAISQALIDSSLAILKALSSIVPPFNFIVAALVAAQTGIQIAAIRSQTFARGGHGELGGASHSQGGIPLPGIGVAERGEYFGIVNKQMTRRYAGDLPAIFDSLNAGKFHDVWSNANIQLQESIDPYTKQMYELMVKTPTVYTDTNGDTVKEYPDGHKRIIRKAG